MQRNNIYPTHKHGEFLLRVGRPFPYGASFVPGGINFSIFSRHATGCTLVLFQRGQPEPLAEIPFPKTFRIGHIFTMIVFGLDYETIEYGYRMDGPFEPEKGHRFDPANILLDPYAKAINGREVWGEPPHTNSGYPYRARPIYDDFDWTGDRPLEIPAEDLIIYEMHVRGFTRHSSSGVKHPGTFAAMREKIPYLQQLGVNAVELMPIHEFDEFDNTFTNPLTGERLLNYWGYNSIGFYAPKAVYASSGKDGMQVDEFKALVKEFHKHGIEVYLDVVFNHSAEGGEDGPTISYRGIDNKTYYMLKEDGRYQNFSGTGNTMNCNNPVVRKMVMDCLRYWVAEYHVDGFRFDLASILGRDANGNPLTNPPLIEAMAYDPILGKTKLIAEAWDAGGLYQVGSFPSYGRWAEWNGKYRDTLRRFLKGDTDQTWEMAQRIQGSPDLYAERTPTASVNFITAHDGFTLADLFAYSQKHNLANGEYNRDGADDNYSWNWGREGPTEDPKINTLRRRMAKNAIAILMVSQGIPMLLMGDEIGRTKLGNNNAYCQDNELNWFDWRLLETNADLLRFVRQCIAFRKAHPSVRRQIHLQHSNETDRGCPDISWHGVTTSNPDWGKDSHTLAFMLCSQQAPRITDDNIYVALNMHWKDHIFELPTLPETMKWHLFADTSCPTPNDICLPGQERLLATQHKIYVHRQSLVILVGR